MHRTLKTFWREHSEWSQETFGLDTERGPSGPLNHLLKEVKEALENPKDLEEYADCVFLIFDAARRAGFTYTDVTQACFRKLEKNKTRKWAKPTAPDQPIEHIRETE